jgi:hypothetical protein
MPLQDINVNVQVPDVEGWLNTLNDYASDAINSAGNVADNLSNFVIGGYTPTVTFDSIAARTSLGSPTKPTKPILAIGARAFPSAPTITTPILTSVAPPVFSTASPDINLPAVPSPLEISLPVKNFIINTDVEFPLPPDTTLPDVPTFLSLNIPTAQSLTIPDFNLDFPTSNSLVVPGITFNFQENLYSSLTLDKVKSELLSRLAGGTGLNPLVEQAIWDRGRDRESKASVLAMRSSLIDQVSRGFSRPVGSTLAIIDLIAQDTQSKIIDLSREIMIKQAELEQENIKTSIQQTIALEDILLREHNSISQRAFEVAKYTQDIAIEIFKLSITKFTSEVEAYRAFATAYSARVQAELSKIEIFKAQIEAEKLKGDINEQNVRLYLARIEGVKSNVEVFKSLISAVSEKLRAEALKIEIYKADVEAYSIGVRAKADEYGIYSEQIKGELAKVDVFDSQVKAFTSRIQAYASQSEVLNKQAETQVSVSELNIKKYESALDAYVKQVQADQLMYQTAVDIYRGETQLYLADISLAKAIADLELQNSQNVIEQNKYKAEIGIQNAQITLESVKGAYNSMITSRQAAGSIYQSIAASALSAINVSASLSGSAGLSASENHNYSA